MSRRCRVRYFHQTVVTRTALEVVNLRAPHVAETRGAALQCSILKLAVVVATIVVVVRCGARLVKAAQVLAAVLVDLRRVLNQPRGTNAIIPGHERATRGARAAPVARCLVLVGATGP